jgi:AraC family transcriptional regulator
MRFRRHEHPEVHLCFVLNGGFLERDGNSWVEMGSGRLRVSGAASHDIDFSAAGADCLLLLASPEDLPAPDRSRFLDCDPWLARVAARLSREPAAEPMAEDLTIEVLAQVRRRLRERSGPPPSWLETVKQRIQDAPHPVSVSALAQEVGVHRVHLARSFREHYGRSVTGYLQRTRLHRARRLLTDRELGLAEVAVMAGFSDQSHMTRATRAAWGVTPATLRRAMLPAFKTPAP